MTLELFFKQDALRALENITKQLEKSGIEFEKQTIQNELNTENCFIGDEDKYDISGDLGFRAINLDQEGFDKISNIFKAHKIKGRYKANHQKANFYSFYIRNDKDIIKLLKLSDSNFKSLSDNTLLIMLETSRNIRIKAEKKIKSSEKEKIPEEKKIDVKPKKEEIKPEPRVKKIVPIGNVDELDKPSKEKESEQGEIKSNFEKITPIKFEGQGMINPGLKRQMIFHNKLISLGNKLVDHLIEYEQDNDTPKFDGNLQKIKQDLAKLIKENALKLHTITDEDIENLQNYLYKGDKGLNFVEELKEVARSTLKEIQKKQEDKKHKKQEAINISSNKNETISVRFKKKIIRALFGVQEDNHNFLNPSDSFIGYIIGRLVLQSQGIAANSPEKGEPEKGFFERFNVTSKRNDVLISEGVTLDTFFVSQSKEEDPKNQTYIIYFQGNASQYGDMYSEIYEDCVKLECNAVAFNYRGVGGSSGSPKRAQDLIDDGIAQVENLLKLGIKPENIILKGQSLGSAIATKVAGHYYDKQQRGEISDIPHIWNARSFSKLSKAASYMLGLPLKLTEKVMSAVGWEIDAATAYKKYPDDHKDYVVVKKASKKIKIVGIEVDDGVIHHKASLHTGVKEPKPGNGIEDETEKTNRKKRNASHKIKPIKDGKVKEGAFGHNEDLEDFVDGKDVIASERFQEFVNNRKNGRSR